MRGFGFLTGPTSKVARWTIVAVAASTVTGVITARSLGPDSRGTLAVVLTLAGLSVLLGTLGSNIAVRTHLPRNHTVVTADYVRLTGLLAGLVTVVLAVAYFVASRTVKGGLVDFGVALAFAAYGISYFFAVQSLDLLNAQGLVSKSAKHNAYGSVFCLFFVSVCWLLNGNLVAVICAYGLSVVFQFMMTVRTLWPSIKASKAHSREGMLRLTGDGLKSMGLNVGQHLAYSSGLIFLAILSTPAQVGLYAVAVTPAALLRIPSNAMGQLFFHQAASGQVTGRKLIATLLKLSCLLLPLAALAWFIATPAFVLVFGDEYVEAVTAFRVLLVAEIALAPFLILGRVLAGTQRMRTASAAGLIGFLTLAAACLWLVPSHGAVGAAWSTLFAYLAMSATAAFGSLFISRHPIEPSAVDSVPPQVESVRTPKSKS